MSAQRRWSRLTPKEHALYACLRDRAGQAVLRDDLMALLWPNPDDEPNAAATMLIQMVQRLRRAGFPVETVYRFGYKLPVKEIPICVTPWLCSPLGC